MLLITLKKKTANINTGNISQCANVNNLYRVKTSSGAPAFHSFCQNGFARLPLINHAPLFDTAKLPSIYVQTTKVFIQEISLASSLAGLVWEMDVNEMF